eukprot:gene2840-1825_t
MTTSATQIPTRKHSDTIMSNPPNVSVMPCKIPTNYKPKISQPLKHQKRKLLLANKHITRTKIQYQTIICSSLHTDHVHPKPVAANQSKSTCTQCTITQTSSNNYSTQPIATASTAIIHKAICNPPL